MPEGIDIVIRVSQDDVQILSVTATDSVTKGRLRAPAITAANWTDFSPRTEELVAEFLTQDGIPIVSYGFAGAAQTFEDYGRTRDDEHDPDRNPLAEFRLMASGPIHDDRFISLPVPEGAAGLAFYRTSVLPGVDQRLGTEYESGQLLGYVDAERTAFGPAHAIRTLLSYSALGLVTREDVFYCPPWPWPQPRLMELEKVLVEFRRVEELGPPGVFQVGLCPENPECGNGKMDGYETIWPIGGETDPTTRYDIVIAGDGFQSGEEQIYRDAAKAFAERLLTLEPFASHHDRIAIHRVDITSEESGLSTDADPKATFLGVWGKKGVNRMLEMRCPCELNLAGRWVARPARLELFVVIGNTDELGAKAKPDLRLAMFGLFGSHDEAFVYARHEIGHAVAGLMEEEIRPGSWECRDLLRARCNVATQDEVDAGTVWWQVLAEQSQLEGGQLTAVHKYGDPTVGGCGETPKFPGNAALIDNVGAFWGAQFIELPVPVGCVFEPGGAVPECCIAQDRGPCFRYNDARGKPFYRPMNLCLMRFMGHDEYCKICRHEIEQAILEPGWGPSPLCCEGMGQVGIADGC